MRLLLIDDDLDLCDSLKEALKNAFVVDVANTGEDGLYLTQLNTYQVLMLDISLPDMDGVEACRMLRSGGFKAPILMLTGQADVNYKIRAMDTGADDYLTKPFEVGELIARLKALDRRVNHGSPVVRVEYKEFVVDTARRAVFFGGWELKLTRHEYDVFECLFKNRGRTLTRDFISQYVWEDNLERDLKGITVHVSAIKRKLKKYTQSECIKPVRSIGYIFE